MAHTEILPHRLDSLAKRILLRSQKTTIWKPSVVVAKGLDRDRAVDESGNQIGVFGRVGARPLNLEEQQRLYLRGGKV